MAVSNSIKSAVEQEIQIDMTPMIDVTFQLLIFFMCTLNFKTMEGILPAYLPKEVGLSAGVAQASPLEPVRIKLLKTTQGVEVWVGSQQFIGEAKYKQLFNQLQAQVLKIHTASLGNLPVIIDPEINVEFQDVVHVLNACRKVQSLPEGEMIEIRFSAKALVERQ